MWYSLAVRLSSPTFRRFARLAAVILLAWTAVDLTATQLCPADGVATVAGGFESSSARSDSSEGPAPGRRAPQSHVDDCFCCSHCVNVALPEPLLAATIDTPRHLAPRLRIPVGDGHPLYHPPQLS